MGLQSVVCVAGARPNFVKVWPVLTALEARGVHAVLVHTGQHYDDAMSAVFFEELGIREPDHFLGAGGGTHAEQTARVMEAFEPVLDAVHPDAVVVVGDVNSTLACAIVAAKAGPLVAHVEAGLRSRDWAMPEEVNRVVADRVSDLLFAPSPDAVENLFGEGYREDQIHLVGNVMVDTLLANVARALDRPVLEHLGLQPREYLLVTLHRPALVDDPAQLDRMVEALDGLASELPIVWPLHPRTRQRLPREPARVRLTEPLGYLDFVALEAQARVVITDSGGVQEETTVLGVPCLTARENTERPITITHGTNRLVGVHPDTVVAAARDALDERPVARRPPLWDGRAAERIADVLCAIDVSSFPRPTERPR